MPDERQDSIRKGIHSPRESPRGTAAEAERKRRVAEDPPMDSAMGGSSDESRPGEEAQANAARAEAEADGAEKSGGGTDEEPLRGR